MTKQESQAIAELIASVNALSLSLSRHKAQTNELISGIEKKVMNQPIMLEHNFNNAIQNTIINALESVMSNNYSSPLKPIIEELTKRNKGIIEDAFLNGIQSLDKEELKSAIKGKLIKDFVKNSINSSGGMIDKFFSDLKQDKAFRARLTILIDNVVRELQNDFSIGE